MQDAKGEDGRGELKINPLEEANQTLEKLTAAKEWRRAVVVVAPSASFLRFLRFLRLAAADFKEERHDHAVLGLHPQ